MYRLLLILLVSVILFTGCKKEESVSSASQIALQANRDEAVIQSYMSANNLTDKFTRAVKDSTGLYYMITNNTADATLYSSSTLITVGYTGSYLKPSGDAYVDTQFTSTDDYHPSFSLGEVIRGWRLCIPNCNKGGTIRILMASRYAYGPYPQPNYGLPANAVLDFTINLYDVTN